MDSGDYVAGLLMGCAPPGLDLAALDGVGGGFLDALCGGGGGGAGLAAARVSGPRCGGSREGSSVSDPAWARAAEGNACRKRKAPAGGCAGKGKEEAFLGTSPCKVGGEAAAKKCKVETKPKVEEAAVSDGGGEVEESGQKRGKGKSSKPSAEPPKDYVHVRARRGQATDSHSLAERVRREKIGQRMKLLQDLVPGCNKVVGKALMLDEIINYVQSLQQQVEFLSMKLATVNPQLDFGSLATFLHKDMYQACGPSVSSGFPLESAGAAFPFCDQADLFQSFGPGIMENQCSLDLLDTALTHATNTQYAFQKQQREIWEDNLQNAMHFNNEQNLENAVSVPDFDGQIQTELEF